VSAKPGAEAAAENDDFVRLFHFVLPSKSW